MLNTIEKKSSDVLRFKCEVCGKPVSREYTDWSTRNYPVCEDCFNAESVNCSENYGF